MLMTVGRRCGSLLSLGAVALFSLLVALALRIAWNPPPRTYGE